MSARSSFAVSSATEAARALEYFNGFHDGFIKRVVLDSLCEFREEFPGNTIIGLFIAPATRRKGGQTTTEPCLGLRLARHVYVEEGRRYDLTESQLFTFTDATFVEVSSP